MEKLQAISQQPGVIMQCGQCYAFENLMENNFTEEMDEYFNRNNTTGICYGKCEQLMDCQTCLEQHKQDLTKFWEYSLQI